MNAYIKSIGTQNRNELQEAQESYQKEITADIEDLLTNDLLTE